MEGYCLVFTQWTSCFNWCCWRNNRSYCL